MNIFTALVAVVVFLWLPMSTIVAVIAVALLMSLTAVRPPGGAPSEQSESPRPRSGVGQLTVEPVTIKPFHDARDVWPMPPDD
ncbi:hypothetical protein [Micromonospora maritima]|uniref:Secreted protein n=1 Tax=Micromonospora maritima TaxID=986711 RepID=A0ABW7ZM17_9ACTN